VARPPEVVFDFVADLENEPRFNPDASNVVQKTPGPIGLGTVFEEDFKRVGHYVTTVDRYERPTSLGFDARNSKVDARVRFEFASADGGAATDVSCTLELTMKGLMRLGERAMAPAIRKEIEGTRGPMLKSALEQG
jgi:Polyketide cyclase / dehydrase and lipid transport